MVYITTFSLYLILIEEVNITAVIRNGNFIGNFNHYISLNTNIFTRILIKIIALVYISRYATIFVQSVIS